MKNLTSLFILLVFTTGVFAQNTIKVSKKETIIVSNADELVEAIASDRTIQLKPGDYQLRDALIMKKYPVDEYIRNVKITDYVTYDPGLGITIRNVKNLDIKGMGKGPVSTQLLTKDLGDQVLTFIECENITIENVKAEHFPATKGGCQGGVYSIQNSKNITIENNILSGSGILAINIYHSENIRCNNTIMEECTAGILDATAGKNITVTNCMMGNNYSHYGFITLRASENVKFENCKIAANYTKDNISDSAKKYDGLIRAQSNKDVVVFEHCTFEKNTIGYFYDSEEKISFKNCTEKKNTFEKRLGGQ